MKKSLKIAVAQVAPVYNDLPACLDKAVAVIDRAASQGAELVVFGETWFCGYPAWLDRSPEAAEWNHPAVKDVYLRMMTNGPTVPGPEIAALAERASRHGIVLCAGLNETVREGPGNGTIFNSFVLIDETGRVAVHRRKLMPTFNEKLVYGLGDGHGLQAAETSAGRIGALICWEHWMPLARQAMHLSGEHVHLALWPSVHDVHQLASRHYAFEGRCFVVAAGQILRVKDMPEGLSLTGLLREDPDRFLLNGGSAIYGPDGRTLLEPVFDREELILYDIKDLDAVYRERMTLDVSGHYNRPDVFDFKINPKRF